MSAGLFKERQLLKRLSNIKLETGFSMLEAVVVVGVLLALAVSGFFSYGAITDNAKRAKVKSAASEVHTGVLVSSMDGNSLTTPKGVIDGWNASTDVIFVEILKSTTGENSANGDFCVQATNKETPKITARTGACSDAVGGMIDTDGDGIPDSLDPDIDGDGIPNTEDTTPNGEGNPSGGESPIPVSGKCTNLSVTEEISCWMNIADAEQMKAAATTGFYFGKGYYSFQPDRPYTGTAFEGLPLLSGFQQEHYEDSDPAWNYIQATVTMAARDGEVWNKVFYNEYNQVNGDYSLDSESGPTGQNVNYNCKYVTPQQLLPVCGRLGMNLNMYSDKKSDNDSTADADVTKALEAQLAYIKINKAPYGGYGTSVDVKSFAGTTYEAKSFSISDGYQAHKVRVMVVSANGDLYTAEARITNSSSSINYTFANTFRYSPEHVASVCGRPYIGKVFQSEDVKTCSTMGYPDFKT